MFREIRRTEYIVEKDRERLAETSREYLNIKPENDTTVEDSKAFWNSLFQREES